MRLRIILTLAVVVPLGVATKFYSGPAEGWVRNHSGGLLYVVFWCLFVLLLRPSLRPWVVAVGVFTITTILEFLQLWHPPLLQAFRSTWLGHALIGSSFAWSDFPDYGVGALLAIGIARIIAHPWWGSR